MVNPEKHRFDLDPTHDSEPKGLPRNHCCPDGTTPHHWEIENPNGPLSQGKCIHCDEVRAFNNTPPRKRWEADPVAAYQRRRLPPNGGRVLPEFPEDYGESPFDNN